MGEEPARLTYSIPEAAAALGISRSFCYELVEQGRLPFVRLGRRKLIPRAALEAYLRQHTRIHGDAKDSAGAQSHTQAPAPVATADPPDMAPYTR